MTKTLRRPEWLKKKIVFDQGRATGALLKDLGLNTVCHEAKCPNISECFKQKHATFLILGKYCTRCCQFCNVEKRKPEDVDGNEPQKVALAVKKMGLKHAVVTSVTRDDLVDGGGSMFAKTTEEIRRVISCGNKEQKITIELLIPDFKTDETVLNSVVRSKPDIIGHNLETVPRLYSLRAGSDYRRSLFVLKLIKKIDASIHTKSALMLGLGEEEKELVEVLEDLRNAGCDFLALGQYLRPSLKNVAVAEYIPPEKFVDYKKIALSLGFKHVESAPYVRSSYHAAEYLPMMI
jgi:lipoic acid synthetase